MRPVDLAAFRVRERYVNDLSEGGRDGCSRHRANPSCLGWLLCAATPGVAETGERKVRIWTGVAGLRASGTALAVLRCGRPGRAVAECGRGTLGQSPVARPHWARLRPERWQSRGGDGSPLDPAASHESGHAHGGERRPRIAPLRGRRPAQTARARPGEPERTVRGSPPGDSAEDCACPRPDRAVPDDRPGHAIPYRPNGTLRPGVRPCWLRTSVLAWRHATRFGSGCHHRANNRRPPHPRSQATWRKGMSALARLGGRWVPD